MMPMGKGKGGMGGGGGMMGGMHGGGGMMEEAPEPELDSDAKVEAIRSALKDLVDLVGGISVEDAKKRKAAPPVLAVEVESEEE
jgi:hypothetical protein